MKKVFIIGSINMDFAVTCIHMPKKGETILGDGSMTNPGGKGANQAAACGKMGADVRFMGCVGDDNFGHELLSQLNSYNVDTKHARIIKGVSSGTAVIVLAEGDNRIIVAANANSMVENSDVDNILKEAGAGDILLTQLEIPLDVVGYALKKGKEKGMVTILNPAPANISISKYLRYVDIIMPNETEARLLANSDDDYEEICKKLNQDYGINIVIITLGGRGHLLYHDCVCKVYPCRKVTVVDTTAAGDTFCGTFAAMLARDMNVKDSLAIASIAATLSVTKKGAQQSIPTFADVINFK